GLRRPGGDRRRRRLRLARARFAGVLDRRPRVGGDIAMARRPSPYAAGGPVMLRLLSAYFAQVRAANRMAFADRANFALQAGGMIVNDGFVLVLWFMFFAGFKSVGGWKLADLGLLMALMMTVVGLAGVLTGGYRDMAAAILRGELDAYLTQPKPVL